MADLRELTTDAKRLYEAMDVLLTKQEEQGKGTEDFQEIWFAAKSRAFTKHILTGEEEHTRKLYLKILAGLTALAEQKENRTAQIRYIARVLAACPEIGIELEAVVSEGLLLTPQDMDEMRGMEQEDVKDALVIDLLLMCYLCGQPEEKQIDFVTGFLAMLGYSREKTAAIGNIVKGLLEQKDEEVMHQSQQVNVGIVYGLMKNPPDGIPVADLEKAKSVKADKIIFSGLTWKAIPVIRCDEYAAEEIEFVDCTFEGVQGMHNITKRVILRRCKFQDCEVKENLLTLVNATIEDCQFIGIRSYDCDDAYLIQLKDSEMTRVEMKKCISRSNMKDVDYRDYRGGMIKSFNSTLLQIKTEEIGQRYGGKDERMSCSCIIKMFGGRVDNWIINKVILQYGYYCFFHDGAVKSHIDISDSSYCYNWNLEYDLSFSYGEPTQEQIFHL